jgi:hypothetical protein
MAKKAEVYKGQAEVYKARAIRNKAKKAALWHPPVVNISIGKKKQGSRLTRRRKIGLL